jgi:hypothetical protein
MCPGQYLYSKTLVVLVPTDALKTQSCVIVHLQAPIYPTTYLAVLLQKAKGLCKMDHCQTSAVSTTDFLFSSMS